MKKLFKLLAIVAGFYVIICLFDYFFLFQKRMDEIYDTGMKEMKELEVNYELLLDSGKEYAGHELKAESDSIATLHNLHMKEILDNHLQWNFMCVIFKKDFLQKWFLPIQLSPDTTPSNNRIRNGDKYYVFSLPSLCMGLFCLQRKS